jgi:biopolymer transport protein TolR
MAMGGGGSSGGVKGDINVTPLVDVVLVLLIIFMVVTPMLTRGKDVPLPKAKVEKSQEPPKDPLVVSITSDGKIWIETNEAVGEDLEKQIQKVVHDTPDRPIMLKGDRALNAGKVRVLMDRVKKAGAKSIDLAVEEGHGSS